MIDAALIEEAKNLLVAQKKDEVEAIAKKIIADGGDPLELMNAAFIPGINTVGDLFGRGQMSSMMPWLQRAVPRKKRAKFSLPR
mgnify:CR=1 FL=1